MRMMTLSTPPVTLTAPMAPVGRRPGTITTAVLAAFVTARAALVLLRVSDGGGATLLDPLAVPALLSQDLVVAGIVAALELLASLGGDRARRVLVALAVLAVGDVAVNVPVAHTLSTPLTYALLNATGGAVSDSIAQQVTAGNCLAFAAVIGAAILAARSRRPLPLTLVLSAGVLAALLGPLATRRIETHGLHRNALAAMVTTTLAQHQGVGSDPALLEAPPLPPEGPALDLRRLSGVAKGRDVLVVILESTGARQLASYGASPDATPNLTALTREGLQFDAISSAYPESIKGLYSVLCASSPAPHTTAALYEASRLPCESVASRFRASGYRTALLHSGRFVYLGMQEVVDGRGFELLADAASIPAASKSSFGVDDLSTARATLAFVDGLKPEERFFATYMPIAGHHPYHSPGEGARPFPEASERDEHRNDLFHGDEALGALIEGLKARGRYENTLFVVIGDHGEAFREHEGNLAHSLFLYQENLAVPLLVAAPGALHGLVRAPQIGSLTDVVPTLLALAGVAPSKGYQGRSLLEGGPGVARFFTDHGALLLGLRQGRWKFIHDAETGRAQLFDLDADPAERHDLSRDEPARVERYRRDVLAFAARQRSLVARP